jgi:predicted nucleic acid-binding protein
VARTVLDPGVLVSALITPTGATAKLLVSARAGSFEQIVSPLLLEELGSVMRRAKFRRYVAPDGVAAYLDLSGDRHLLDLAGTIPVFTPAEFLAA